MNQSDGILQEFFAKIYVINLASRGDRRAEMQAQLNKIGLSLEHPSVFLFDAVRPDLIGEWPSIGARGCFMSHLGVLQHADRNKFKSILILEDDINFVENFEDRFRIVVDALAEREWGIFYGGYQIPKTEMPSTKNGVVALLKPEVPVTTTHFIAFEGKNIREICSYLEAIVSRKSGDPLGGPMHVDGAYSWYRREFVKTITLISTRKLGYQRSSRTDISDLKWIDKLLLTKNILSILRKIKNGFLERVK